MKFTDVPGETVSARIRRVDGGSFEQHFSNGSSSLPISHLLPSVTAGVFDLDLGKTMVGVTPINMQSVQVLVGVPATEYVPAAQLATTALAVEVQVVVTRWPGPAVEQAVQVGFAPATDAK